MIAYPAPMLRLIRRRARLTAMKQAARYGHTAIKGLTLGTGIYLALVFVLGSTN